MAPTRTDLDSGAVVVSDARPGVEGISFGLYFRTGSRHESATTNGVSHFIEHLVFKGTPTRSADAINREIDLLGGGSNAYTTKETICLYSRVLADQLPRALDLFTDLASNGLPDGIEAEVERERGVILSEIRSVDDTPEDLVGDLLDAAFYGEHPLARPIMGSVEAVEGLSVSDLRDHYRRRLAQGPAVVAAAGRLDHAELVEEVARWLDGRAVASVPEEPAPQLRPGHRLIERDLEQVHLSLCGQALASRDPRWAVAELLSLVVGDGYSSRLFREVRDRRGLAYSIYSSLVSYTDAGSFNVDFGVAPERLAEAVDVVGRVLVDVRDGGVEQEELDAAKQHLLGSLVLGHESSGAGMAYLAEQILSGDDNLELAVDLAAIERVRREEVCDLAQEILGRPLALAAVGPVPRGSLPEGPWELGS